MSYEYVKESVYIVGFDASIVIKKILKSPIGSVLKIIHFPNSSADHVIPFKIPI